MSEYEQISIEHATLHRLGAARTPLQQQRYEHLGRRLREILATPPHGYSLPPAAATLVDHARAAGWRAEVCWVPADGLTEVHVRIQVGRRIQPGELDDPPGPMWLYELTWHSRGCPPGRVRRFGRILARTPEQPAVHEVGSVRAVEEAIGRYPAPELAA